MKKCTFQLIIAAFLLVVPASAANIVGNIILDNYTSNTGATATDTSGVTFTAHYEVTDPATLANCCTQLRWLQLVTSSTPTGFTPTPNRPFIDPRVGQIGGIDALPFYDFTYPTSALTGQNSGVGPYIFDMPAVLNSRAVVGTPYSFIADTLLVCLYDDNANPKQLIILGGFEWGFTITATNPGPTYSSSTIGINGLPDTAQLRNSFNTALGLDYPGYQIVSSVGTRCENCTFQVIPEPSPMYLLSGGAALVILVRRRRLARL